MDGFRTGKSGQVGVGSGLGQVSLGRDMSGWVRSGLRLGFS